jgi:hypothetical protein
MCPMKECAYLRQHERIDPTFATLPPHAIIP